MSLPPVIATDRLTLPLLTSAEVADLLAGRHHATWHAQFPRPDDRDAATMWREGDSWGPRGIVVDGLTTGSIGFFGPPEDHSGAREAEVGYGLVEAVRGRGYATEALRALLVETDRVGVRVRASVQPANRASIRVLATCGFTEIRGTDDEGQLVMARPLPR